MLRFRFLFILLFSIAPGITEAMESLTPSMGAWGAVYPGQGSQHRGMGEFLYRQFPYVQTLFKEASDRLKVDFVRLCFAGEECELALTENTQPCLLLASAAAQKVLSEEVGFSPVAVAGHSVGEYAAVVGAGAVSFGDAMSVVRRRGMAMQRAVPPGEGGMLAVTGLNPQQAQALCQWAERSSGLGPVEPANLNAPGQVVLSGRRTALEWIVNNYKQGSFDDSPRIRSKFLNVSGPFHCSMMRPAQEEMAEVLGRVEFADAKIPVVQNVSARAEHRGDVLRKNLIGQISGPVRWMECVTGLRAQGVSRLVEVGSGTVLAGLNRKIDPDMRVFSFNSLEDLKALRAECERKP